MNDRRHLLTDDEVMSFVIKGYHIIETDLGEGFNRSVYDQLDAMTEYPQSTIMDLVPKLGEVFEHPKVQEPSSASSGMTTCSTTAESSGRTVTRTCPARAASTGTRTTSTALNAPP